MTLIIIIGLIFIFFNATKKREPINRRILDTNSYDKNYVEQKNADESANNDSDNITAFSVIATNSLGQSINDDSIIDVTDQSYSLKSKSKLIKHSLGVPYWTHQYVYSFSDLNNASDDQKKFYKVFKANFVNGQYINLEGYTNYAFVLLFDLLKEYDADKDKLKLESQLKILGQYYPHTKSHCISFLMQRMGLDGYVEEVSKLKTEQSNDYFSYNPNYNYEYLRLGSKYKSTLNLSDDDEKLLNKIWYHNNNFCSIEFCCLEVLKLYISVFHELKTDYQTQGTTIEKEFLSVAGQSEYKELKFGADSHDYKNDIESTLSDFYLNIFKLCENAVREFYGHKRKLNTDLSYLSHKGRSEYEARITSKVLELLPTLSGNITKPNEATEIELNAQTTSRWKNRYEELITNFGGATGEFFEEIIELGRLNKKNPSQENIFFEASKFIAKFDKVASLKLYVYYLHYDLNSANFENKQMTKSIQKNLFKTDEQLQDFEQIVSELIKDKDLEKALIAIPKIYEIKRKKILLDRTTISEVQQQHSGTVELLNEYLRDGLDDEDKSTEAQEISKVGVEIEIKQKKEERQQTVFLKELTLSPLQISTLELFSKSNFSVTQLEIDEFAKSKGVFKNQLIDSINETCYDVLDDILIEEDHDSYTIIPEYLQKISAK